MNLSERYHTPPLSAADRKALHLSLGFGDFKFFLAESVDGILYRVSRFTGLESKTQLGVKSWEDCESHRKQLPAIYVNHRVGFPVVNLEARTLWEELLPHPFRELSASVEMMTAPSDLKQDFLRLVESVKRFDASLAQEELSLVRFGGKGGGCPLLFHYFQGKRLRVGTKDELRVLADRCSSGQWGPADLEAHFGSSVAFFEVPLPEGGNPLVRLADGLSEATAGHFQASSVPELQL